MESCYPIYPVKNPNPLNEDHIIDFVRKRNHATKHLDLFPRDIEDVKALGYGRTNLGGQSYIFDVVNDRGTEMMRIYMGDARDPKCILPMINSFAIQPDNAYVLYTTALTNTYVYCGMLTVPEQTNIATAWALGLVAKNRISPSQVQSMYHANRDSFDKAHVDNPMLPDDAYKAHFRKFNNWLCGTWVSDRNGDSMNAKITWGISNYEPTHQDAIDFLKDMHVQCNTVSAKARIEYVMSELEKRQRRTNEHLEVTVEEDATC